MRSLVHLALGLLILIWGTTWAAIRIGLEGIPPFTGVALRFALASLVLVTVARILRQPLGSTNRDRALWLVNGLLSFACSYGVVYWAEQWVPSGLAAVLFSTFPLFVALMAHFLLPEERLTASALTGVAVGFVGVVVIFSEDLAGLTDDSLRLPAMLFLISPLVSAIANVAIKRWGGGVGPFALTAVPMGLAAAVMGGLALLVERERPVSLDPTSVAAVLYLAIFGTAVTFVLYFWLLSRLRATRLSLITYGVPIVAVTVGTVFLGEPFTPRMLAGSVLVLVGVALALGLHRGW